jgi:ferredoxin-NADP reductase
MANLNSLDPMKFTTLVPERKKHIASSDETFHNPQTHVSALAAALHPHEQHLIITQVKENTPECKTYTLQADPDSSTKRTAFFQAGSYLSVEVEINGKIYRRPYSICSSPQDARKGFYQLTIKSAPHGLVSNWILQHWKVGNKVTASAPLGNFTYSSLRDGKHVIALAGGSGITPFLSMAKAIAENDEDFSMTLLYGNRDEESLLFKDELDALVQDGKLQVVYVLSDEQKEGFEHGLIDAKLIQKYMPQDETCSIFICGPDAMYHFLEDELPKLNLKRKWIRQDCSEFHSSLHERIDYPKEVPDSVQVTIIEKEDTTTITVGTQESLLSSLEKSGFAPRSHCRSGECGWCHSRLVKGDVYIIDEKDGSRQADKKFGYIHPCISYPLSDCVIELR